MLNVEHLHDMVREYLIGNGFDFVDGFRIEQRCAIDLPYGIFITLHANHKHNGKLCASEIVMDEMELSLLYPRFDKIKAYLEPRLRRAVKNLEEFINENKNTVSLTFE